MGLVTTIPWADTTWNPWQGCTKVSPECQNCYMYRNKARYGQDATTVVRSAPGTFRLPLAKYGARATKGEPGTYKIPPGSKVFPCSWSDFFHEQADPWRPEAWAVIRQRPDLVFMILTKRADRIVTHLPPDWGTGWPNVWLGVTVGAQSSVHRIANLTMVSAAVRFVSAEPLIERVDFGPLLAGMDWLIIGGESGPQARPMHLEWARSARDQAQQDGLAVHFKQWGEWFPRSAEPMTDGRPPGEADPMCRKWPAVKLTSCGCNDSSDLPTYGVRGGLSHPGCGADPLWMQRVGVRLAGRTLDGEILAEFPTLRTP